MYYQVIWPRGGLFGQTNILKKQKVPGKYAKISVVKWDLLNSKNVMYVPPLHIRRNQKVITLFRRGSYLKQCELNDEDTKLYNSLKLKKCIKLI